MKPIEEMKLEEMLDELPDFIPRINYFSYPGDYQLTIIKYEDTNSNWEVVYKVYDDFKDKIAAETYGKTLTEAVRKMLQWHRENNK